MSQQDLEHGDEDLAEYHEGHLSPVEESTGFFDVLGLLIIYAAVLAGLHYYRSVINDGCTAHEEHEAKKGQEVHFAAGYESGTLCLRIKVQ